VTANLRTVASVRSAFLPLLLVLAANAAGASARPPELTAIVEISDSAPPEFRADALLRLAESNKVADPAWKRELIGQAFVSAASVRVLNPERAIGQSAPAGRPALDRLSLQTRAVNDLRPLDGRKAREMFLEIVKPVPRQLECAGTSWDDLGAWYASAAQLVATFSPIERNRQDHVNFAVRELSTVTSILEVAPAQALLTVPAWRQDEKDLLGAKFAGMLETLTSSARSFTAVQPEARQAVESLAASGYDPELFRGAWTRLLARQQAVEPCPVLAKPTAGFGGAQMSAPAPPVSPQAAHLASRWMSLMLGPRQQGLTDAEKNTTAWRDELAAYLGEIDDLKADTPEGELDIYQMKTEALGGLLMTVPAGEDRDRVRARYVAVLAASPVQQQDAGRWFTTVKQLLESTGLPNSPERLRLLAALESTGNPALLLYAKLERTIPLPPSFGPNAK
jgi:hypothetical protein